MKYLELKQFITNKTKHTQKFRKNRSWILKKREEKIKKRKKKIFGAEKRSNAFNNLWIEGHLFCWSPTLYHSFTHISIVVCIEHKSGAYFYQWFLCVNIAIQWTLVIWYLFHHLHSTPVSQWQNQNKTNEILWKRPNYKPTL